VLPAFFVSKSPDGHCLNLARDWPDRRLVTLRQRLARTLVGTLIFVAACVSVGLTAPADGPFSIGIRPVFLGIDVDIKVGTLHLHYGWSAIPLAALRPASTKPAGTLL
jgi:hypothetical protein